MSKEEYAIALLNKLPSLDVKWSDEIRAEWWKCYTAIAEMVFCPAVKRSIDDSPVIPTASPSGATP